jgi:hypothetical protein
MIGGFFTEGGREYLPLENLRSRDLYINLTRKRIAVFPDYYTANYVLGCTDFGPQRYYNDFSLPDGSQWIVYNPSFGDFYGFLRRRKSDWCDILACNRKIKIQNDKPVNGLKTEVEQYYLIIPWEEIDRK